MPRQPRAWLYRGRAYREGDTDIPDALRARMIPDGEEATVASPPATSEPDAAPSLESVSGIGPEIVAVLTERGIVTIEDVRAASDTDLLAVPGIGKATLAKLREAGG